MGGGKSKKFYLREGLEAVKRVVKAASDIRIQFLTLFPIPAFLTDLIRIHLKNELRFYRESRIKIIHSGNLDGMPPEARKDIKAAVAATADYDGLKVNFALNYSGRDEIVRASIRWLDGQAGKDQTKLKITENELANCLDHPGIPDVDIAIITGGEMKISNFLIWKSAYAELFFSPLPWPDWSGKDLEEAVSEYQQRERRFGSTN
jgi:undecaprenyl diphosphate synthase